MGKFVTVDLQAADGATKRVVRSYLGLKYHAQNYERLMAQVRPLGISGRVVGGGRISMAAASKTISVYGYSKTYGRAPGCNEATATLLQKVLPDWAISWSDEAY